MSLPPEHIEAIVAAARIFLNGRDQIRRSQADSRVQMRRIEGEARFDIAVNDLERAQIDWRGKVEMWGIDAKQHELRERWAEDCVLAGADGVRGDYLDHRGVPREVWVEGWWGGRGEK